MFAVQKFTLLLASKAHSSRGVFIAVSFICVVNFNVQPLKVGLEKLADAITLAALVHKNKLHDGYLLTEECAHFEIRCKDHQMSMNPGHH